MMDSCEDCKHYCKHYVKNRFGFSALLIGHCPYRQGKWTDCAQSPCEKFEKIDKTHDEKDEKGKLILHIKYLIEKLENLCEYLRLND